MQDGRSQEKDWTPLMILNLPNVHFTSNAGVVFQPVADTVFRPTTMETQHGCFTTWSENWPTSTPVAQGTLQANTVVVSSGDGLYLSL